ncbi:MAG TPA: prepilin-type N-terminal cleavage/methylation domain-containing protein [Luteimonas sp.]|nr:prepilin-type N-terminal cleavage/methylation domain-containing protein [Luteimonas sp.]
MRLSHAKWVLGFTLIELMVTLAVMAIVLVAAVPSFVDFFDKNRVRGAADGVISVISNARAESVKNDLDVNLAFTGSGTAWCLGANAALAPGATGGPPFGSPAPGATACTCTDPTSTTQCRVSGQRSAVEVAAYPGVAIGALPAATIFDGKLGAISPLGVRNVTLTSPKGKYDLTVEVNALGQARLCVPTGKPSIAGIAACAP